MTEIESLVARSRKYLRSADILIKEGDYESSVSRTYYAMFYSIEALLLTKDISPSSHKGIISLFGEHFIKSGALPKEMSKELNRTFEKRQLSDYESDMVLSETEAVEILNGGQRFVERCISYLKENQHL
jgi:uncharacterized protein (UPF0332 family)